MRYVIELPEGIHQKIIRLLAHGKYSTFQDFAIIAIQNQILLEETQGISPDSKGMFLFDAIGIPYAKDDSRYKLKSLGKTTIKSIPPKMSNLEPAWIFGQINRILPIKYGLRVLITLVQESGEWVPLDEFHKKASLEARHFGQILRWQDEKKDRNRSDRFSVGFPIGELSKSLDRYKSQFLGTMQPSTGVLFGALPTLLFSVISFTKKQYLVGITQAGKEFGLLPNPVLDQDSNQEEAFSKEETRYYIDHIRANVQHEADAFRTLLELIHSGCDETNCIDKEISRKFPEWSNPQIATNRSGVIGRMRDLNLISREYQGQSIRYFLTDLGRESLRKLTKTW